MARSHARLSVTVWGDDDYADLSPTAQWFYAHLLAHPRLSLVGTIDLAEKRWARLSKHATQADIDAAIAELECHEYLVIDWDTDEVMVRSFTRHDLAPGRVNKNLAAGFWRAYDGILSPELRSVAAHAIPADLWDRLAEHAPPQALHNRRSPRLEPQKRPRSQPDPCPRFEPETDLRSQPTPPSPSPSSLIPQTSPSSSSSQSDSRPEPLAAAEEEPISDDDQTPPAPPGDPRGEPDEDHRARHTRAVDICTVIGTDAHDRRAALGGVTSPDRHRRACIDGAKRDHLEAVQLLINEHPDWDDERIAAHRTRPPIEKTTVALEDSRHPAALSDADRRARDADQPPTASAETVTAEVGRAREALQRSRTPDELDTTTDPEGTP